jgi:hypothetical protein
MGSKVDRTAVAEQWLKQYRDIPSLDKSRNLLVEKYGESTFNETRKLFAKLWLKQNGHHVPESEPVNRTSDVGKSKIKTKKAKKGPLCKNGFTWKRIESVNKSVDQKTIIQKQATSKPVQPQKPVTVNSKIVPIPKTMKDNRGEKVVSTWVDPEENMKPIHLTLKVLRRMTISGKLCYVVKYGPNGVDPYEWYVSVVNKSYENLSEIPCIYYKHTLEFDNDSSLLKNKQPEKKIYTKTITSNWTNIATELPKSTPVKKDKPKVSFKSDPAPMPIYRKPPEQWRAEVGMYDKHKCGKPFVCNCCGRSFDKNQGYRIELKEIYFCFECKKKIFKPSHKGWRGSVISIPMGNKR